MGSEVVAPVVVARVRSKGWDWRQARSVVGGDGKKWWMGSEDIPDGFGDEVGDGIRGNV
jgi:hypothetical protein